MLIFHDPDSSYANNSVVCYDIMNSKYLRNKGISKVVLVTSVRTIQMIYCTIEMTEDVNTLAAKDGDYRLF